MKQQQLIFRTWGGRRKGAGRKRHTDELPHLARPEVRPNQPQHVTIRVRPDVISLRKSRSFAAIKQAFRLARERLGMRVCHFSVLGNHIHVVDEAGDRVALARAITGLNIRFARALNRLMTRKGQVIADRYHVHALKTPMEVRNALRYLLLNARRHGLTTSESPDPYSSWANQDVVAQPHSWLLRRGFERAGPLVAAAPTSECGPSNLHENRPYA